MVINITLETSNGTSKKWSVNSLFCSGSNSSKSAAAGSPRQSLPILSISSSRNTGFILLALLIPWIMRPGIEPIYVLRWPRISLSSRTPPKDIRTNLRPMARAMDLAKEVFPTPGAPAKQSTGPRRELFNLLTAKYSNMRSLGFSKPKWSSSKIFLASFKSSTSSVVWFQGILTSQSK